MSDKTLEAFSQKMQSKEFPEDVAEDVANVFIKRGAEKLNETFAEKHLTLTPPGTICGNGIKIASHKLITFKITATLSFGEVCMNLGFAEGD